MSCGSRFADEGLVKNKAVDVALALNPAGDKRAVERAEQRREVLAQVTQWAQGVRVNDILIAVVGGLKGFLEARTGATS
jgi:putative transposase